MKSNTGLALLGLAASTIGAPVSNTTAKFDISSEDASIAGLSDTNILAFALVLEHLETAFYNEAIKKYSASDFADGVYEEVLRLGKDESTHVDTLTTVLKSLGAYAPEACKYSFPYKSAEQFIALASIIEGVGVSAYSGAAVSVKNPAILGAAASILSVEARHDAILRLNSGVVPYPNPFDTPLDFNQVWSLASPFIVPGSCQLDSSFLKLTAFPALAVTSTTGGNGITNPTKVGATITLKADIEATSSIAPRHVGRSHEHLHHKKDAAASGDVYAAFLTSTGAIIAETEQQDGTFTVEVPEGLTGQTYVILVSDKNDIHDSTTLAGPAVLEVESPLGPTVVYEESGSGQKC